MAYIDSTIRHYFGWALFMMITHWIHLAVRMSRRRDSLEMKAE
jgi:hypothetical protein